MRVQNPVMLDGDMVPQPDLAVIVDRGPDALAVSAADTLLAIEVSDSTLAYDRGEKLALYAGASIPEYWIVDVQGTSATRYTAPHGETYTQATTARAGESLRSTTIPAIVIPVADILS